MNATLDLTPARRKLVRATRRRTRAWTKALAGVGIVLAVGSAFGSAALVDEDPGVVQELDALQLSIEKLESRRGVLSDEIRVASASLRLVREIGSQPDWSHLLVMLAGHTSGDLTLDSLNLGLLGRSGPTDVPPPRVAGNGPYALGLQGRAREQEHVTEFILSLEDTGIFNRVNLVRSQRSSDGNVSFNIECELGNDPESDGGGA